MGIIYIIILAFLFVVVLTILFYHKKIFIWLKKHKKLGAILITTMIAAPTGVLLYLGDEVNEPPIIIDAEAYIWYPGAGYGSMPRWEVNRTYAKQFLKDNMKWRLQASNDNITWQNANELLDIDLNWSEANCSYKVTLTLNTTLAPKALYYRFDLACNKSLKNYFEADGTEWRLIIPANNTKDYTLLFNWSDIKPLIQNGKVWFDKGVKDNFFWFRVQTVNKIPVGIIFVVDPLYGIMPAAVTDSFEWDIEEGQNYHSKNNIIRLNNSEYYLIAFKGESGTENDGYVCTIRVWNNNGTIRKTRVDSWEFDTSDSQYFSLDKIPNTDIYVLMYYDSGANKETFITFKVSDVGVITKSKIDTQVLSQGGNRGVGLRLTNNIFARVYSENVGADGWMETVWISSTGTINNSVCDTQEFDIAYCYAPHICIVDSDTVAIVYSDSSDDGRLVIYNVSGSGVITDTNSSWWEFDATIGFDAFIKKISGNVFTIAYQGAATDGFVKTLTISNAGTVTKSFIDSLEFHITDMDYPLIFTINDGSVYGISYQDVASGDGWIDTVNISRSGDIGAAIIDTMEFDVADTIYWSPVVWVNQSKYLVVWEGTNNDGWSATFNITTNWASPTFSSPSPANNSVDQALTPQCAITINDKNGDTVNVYFAENSTGSWVIRQANTSVACNGTYKWTFDEASAGSTKYYWKVFVNDTTHNVSTWYCFTTASANTAPTMDSFNIDTEPGATAGWDWDNNDAQMDWTTTDDDADPVTVYITYNKGSTARLPTTADYDFHIQDDDATDLDCNWETVAGWTDYDGAVYVRIRAYDGTVYSNTQINDTLAEGIDGTDPTGTIDAIADNINPVTIDGDSADAISGIASNDITIFDDDDNLYWDGDSWEVGVGWLDCTGTTSWTYDSSAVTWEAGHDIIITVRIYNGANQVDAAADTELFTTFLNTAPVVGVVSPLNHSFDNSKTPQISVAVTDADDATQKMNITWQSNSSGAWVTFGQNNSVDDGTYKQYANNFTISGTKYYWRVIVNDGHGGWDNHSYDFTLSNDTVWYKSSSYNCYIEIGDLHFDPIVISSQYVMFNTTDFKVTSTNRTNVSIIFINTSITGADVNDLLVDFYASNKGGLVRFNISGFVPTGNYTVKKNGASIGDYTANVTGNIIFTNTIGGYAPRFQIYLKAESTSDIYTATIRTYAGDYFTWLGKNTSAYTVYKNLTGMNEAAEYIAIWNTSEVWGRYNGDKTGWNFTIHTFDVVRTYMNDAVGNITFNMVSNPDIDYDAHRTVKLYPEIIGYNYTGYTNITATTLNGINQTLDLGQGYFCGLWNRTTFTWNIWIADFGITDKVVSRWDVIMTKLAEDDDKTWVL